MRRRVVVEVQGGRHPTLHTVQQYVKTRIADAWPVTSGGAGHTTDGSPLFEVWYTAGPTQVPDRLVWTADGE